MLVRKSHDGWHITSAEPLTAATATALTFRAEPRQVTLGDYVEVDDPDGVRIGHVSGVSYHERFNGPAYVVVSITLR